MYFGLFERKKLLPAQRVHADFKKRALTERLNIGALSQTLAPKYHPQTLEKIPLATDSQLSEQMPV